MTEVKRILCPTDLSEASARAFDYAMEFARSYEAALTLLHVVAPVPLVLGSTGNLPPSPPDEAAVRRAALDRLVADRVPERGPKVEAALTKGDPAEEIVARVQETNADLLVVGAHGRHGIQRWLLGSVTEELLRRAPCPVLVVPPHAGAAPPPVRVLLERLVCAIDFSDASLRAGELAFSLAGNADARLVLLHVVETAPLPTPSLAPTGAAVLGRVRELATAAEDDLRRVVPAGASDGCEVVTRVVTGNAWREIVREAAEQHAGLIVMGAHGNGPLDRLSFGSTATLVVRHAGCPVLVARPPLAVGRSSAG